LGDLAHRGAALIIREHRGLPGAILTPRRPRGCAATGKLAEHRVRVGEGQGGTHPFRRLRITWDHARRDGAMWR
jgi:hypothetical protein